MSEKDNNVMPLATDPHNLGEFDNVYDAMRRYPNGGVDGDYIYILGVQHFWNVNRQSWGILKDKEDNLVQMVEDFIGLFERRGYVFAGYALPDTTPVSGLDNIFYIAAKNGVYTHFGSDLKLLNEVAILRKPRRSSIWIKDSMDIPNSERIDAIDDAISRINVDIKTIKSAIIGMENDLDGVHDSIDDINKDIDAFKKETSENFEEVNSDLDKVEKRLDYIPKESFLSARPAGFKPDIDLTPEITVDRAWRDHEGNVIRDTYTTRRGLRNEIIDITNQQVTDLKPGSVDPDDLSEATKQLIGNKSITNLPDEEDITVTDNQTLKLKDKEYAPKDYSGMGRVYLRKHYVNGVNTLTQHMMRKPNTIYIIQYDYCLAGQTIEVPENCVLQFEGGSFRNGTLQGSKTKVISKFDNVIFSNIDFSGSFVNSKLKTSQFGFISDLHTVSQYWTYKKMNIDIEVYTGTDNRSEWDNLNSFINNSHNIELFIDGEYYTNSNWHTLIIVNSSNLKIHGGVVDIAFYFRSCHDVEIHDIVFVGLHKPHEMPMRCIKEENISETVFHLNEGTSNLGITNEAIAIQTLVDNQDIYSYNFNIYNCEFYMRSNGVFIGNNRLNTNTIRNVVIRDCIGNTIYYQTIGLHCSDTMVYNIVTYNNGQSIDISSGCHNVIVDNCRCNSDGTGPKQDSISESLSITKNNELKNSYFNIIKKHYVDSTTYMLHSNGLGENPFIVSNCIFESSADECFVIRCSNDSTLYLKDCTFIQKQGTAISLVTYSLDTDYRGKVYINNCNFNILSNRLSNYATINGLNGDLFVENSKIDLGDFIQKLTSDDENADISINIKNSYLKYKTVYDKKSQISNIVIENSILDINSPIDVSKENANAKLINNIISSDNYIMRIRANNSNIDIIGNCCSSRGVILHLDANNVNFKMFSNSINSSNTKGDVVNGIFVEDEISPSFNAIIADNIFLDTGVSHERVYIVNSSQVKNSFKYFGVNRYMGAVYGYDTLPIPNYGYNPNPSDKDVHYDLEKKNFYIAFSGEYYDYLGNPKDAKVTGSTSDRPVDVKIGFFYKDTTLNKPIWWDGTNWVDATGATV